MKAAGDELLYVFSTSCSPVLCVICLLVIICLHLGSISSLFLFCFRHWRMFLASASVQNRCRNIFRTPLATKPTKERLQDVTAAVAGQQVPLL